MTRLRLRPLALASETLTAAAALGLVALAAGCATTGIERPPVRYQDDGTWTVTTGSLAETHARCRLLLGERADGGTWHACATADGHVYAPNPCLFEGDWYADLTCHEFAHPQGFTHPGQRGLRPAAAGTGHPQPDGPAASRPQSQVTPPGRGGAR
jgi:hypothetical protein